MNERLVVGVLGTELADLDPSSGGLEKLAAGWATELANHFQVVPISMAHQAQVDPGAQPSSRELGEITRGCDLLVINNRPGWLTLTDHPAVLVLHNTSEAWGDFDREGIASKRFSILTVSRWLSRHAQEVFDLSEPPPVIDPFVDDEFLGAEWIGGDQIVFPNRLMAKKGVIETLQALDQLADRDIRVTFIENISPWESPTAEHRELIAAIQSDERCRLIPRIGEAKGLARLIARSKGVICPSTKPEGFGLAPLEALAVGAPTLVSTNGGLGELVRLGAVQVDPGDTRQFAKTLADLWRSPGSMRVNPRVSKQAIATRFQRQASTATLVAALVELASR